MCLSRCKKIVMRESVFYFPNDTVLLPRDLCEMLLFYWNGLMRNLFKLVFVEEWWGRGLELYLDDSLVLQTQRKKEVNTQLVTVTITLVAFHKLH